MKFSTITIALGLSISTVLVNAANDCHVLSNGVLKRVQSDSLPDCPTATITSILVDCDFFAITSQEYTSIDPKAFDRFPRLTNLVFKNCNGVQIPDKLFEPLTGIKSIEVNGGNVSLKNNAFVTNTMLQSLTLNSVTIDSVDENFIKSNDLEFLSITDVKGTAFDSVAIDKMLKEFSSSLPDCSELENLKIRGVDTIKSNIFNGKSKLTGLFIESTNMAQLSDGFLNNLIALKEVTITESALTSLRSNLFAQNINLESIKLNKNAKLASIPGDLFANNIALRTVEVVGNSELTSIPGSLFNTNVALTTVFINHSPQLNSISNNLFHTNTALTEIQLNNISMSN
eukprot:Pgem_evm2s77